MRLLRIHEVTNLTGLSRSSIYKQIKLENFPGGVKITNRSTAWPSDEIDEWISERVSSRSLIKFPGSEQGHMGKEEARNGE
mgnify:FL=1